MITIDRADSSTALAHDIHEQIMVHRRSLFLVGHTPGSGFIQDDEVRAAFLPPIEGSTLRKEDIAMAGYTPIFATFTEEDISAIEKERDRDAKRKKRATRARRGIVLPDREPPKTHRSLLNLVGPNGLAPISVPEVVVAAPTTSRRAAAIAAQANINLLAQDLPLPQAPSPPPAAPSKRGRWPRNQRAASREESVVTQTNGDQTPTLLGKRGLREDSFAEGVLSPVPHKKRYNGTTPEVGTPVKMEFEMKPPVLIGQPGWHCGHCGVPEHLAGGMRNDSTGRKTLCTTCGMSSLTSSVGCADDLAQHLNRQGRPRIVQYNEDEEFHRQRIEASRRKRDNGVPESPTVTMGDMPPSQAVTPFPAVPSPLPPPQQYLQPQPQPQPQPQHHSQPQQQMQPQQLPPPTHALLNRGPSEDSDSDSSDEDDSDDDFDPRSNSQPIAKPTPGRTVSASGAITTSPTGIVKRVDEAPAGWIEPARIALAEKYPKDSFGIVPKVKSSPDAPQEWRIKCHDWYVGRSFS